MWSTQIPTVVPLTRDITADTVATIRNSQHIINRTITTLAETQGILNTSYFKTGQSIITLPFGDYAVRAFNISSFNGSKALKSGISQSEASSVLNKIYQPVEEQTTRKLWLEIIQGSAFVYRQLTTTVQTCEIVFAPISGTAVTNELSLPHIEANGHIVWDKYPKTWADVWAGARGKLLI